MTVGDLTYDGWPECWCCYGSHVGSSEPVTIRVGIYQPNNDPDASSIALCTSGGKPILIDEQEAHELRKLLDWSIKGHRIDLIHREERRHAAARELVGAAVLNHDRWSQLMAAVQDGGNVDALPDIISCAPESWRVDDPTPRSADAEE